MGLFKQLSEAKKTKKELSSLSDGKDISYFQHQSRKLAVERDIQAILRQYYDDDTCEMIPIQVPGWAVEIVTKELDSNGIKYIVKDGEVDIICE